MDNQLQKQVLDFWCGVWQCDAHQLEGSGTFVSSLEKYRGSDRALIYRLQAGADRSIVTVDPALEEVVQWLTDEFGQRGVADQDFLEKFSSENVQAAKPALLAYLSREKFAPVVADEKYTVRRLEESDVDALDDLKNYCSELEVYQGYVEIDDPVVYGCFDGDQLVAVGSFLFWGELIGDLGVLTHPEYRRQGLGKAVISALCHWAFEQGKIPQYRNSVANSASEKLAQSLGFEVLFEEQELIFNESEIIFEA